LYFPGHLRALIDDFAERDRDAKYLEIRSPHGHDAFLIEWDQMERALRWALEGA
jgi:homoserine O-acetyltransferase